MTQNPESPKLGKLIIFSNLSFSRNAYFYNKKSSIYGASKYLVIHVSFGIKEKRSEKVVLNLNPDFSFRTRGFGKNKR